MISVVCLSFLSSHDASFSLRCDRCVFQRHNLVIASHNFLPSYVVLTILSLASQAKGIECVDVFETRPALLPDGIPMKAQARKPKTDDRTWKLDITNWQGKGNYPYPGLSFIAEAHYSAYTVDYNVQVIEEKGSSSQVIKKRKFYVSYNVNRETPNRVYYIDAGDRCTKQEFNDAVSTDVVLYEYTV